MGGTAFKRPKSRAVETRPAASSSPSSTKAQPTAALSLLEIDEGMGAIMAGEK
jgi:hypothetical protein